MKYLSGQLMFVVSFLTFIIILGVSTILISNNISSTKVVSIATPEALNVLEVPISNATVLEERPVETEAPPTVTPTIGTTQINSQKKNSLQNKPTSQVAGAKTDSCEGTMVVKFTCLLNEYRKTKNLGNVSYNSSLAKVAYNHSNWMNSTKTLSHVDANGFRHNDRCAQEGIVCRAENLAEGYLDANILLSEWQKSGGHNINLLGPYSTIGLGVSGKYVTLIFN